MRRLLACDGPAHLNGRYIDAETAAANGYVVGSWPTGEAVYFHVKTLDTLTAE